MSELASDAGRVPGRTPDATPPTPGRGRTVLRRLLPAVRPVVALCILAAVVYAVASKWSGVRKALDTLAWTDVTLSAAAALAGTLTGMMAWRALLASEGHPLSGVAAGRIFFVGQLGRYLPGSVWSIVLQMELGRRAGVPRARAFTTSLVWVGLSLATGLCLGAFALPRLEHSHPREFWVLLAIIPVAVVASLPPVLTRLVNFALGVMRKSPLPRALTWRGVGSAAGWLVITWVLYGVHLWLLSDSLGADGFGGFLRCMGGFALAVGAGVIFVVAPSGAGVREAVIVASLAGVVPTGEALGVAVVSRVMFVFVDLITAGAAALSGRLVLGPAATESPAAAD